MTVMAIATGLHGLTDRKKGVSCLWYATLFFCSFLPFCALKWPMELKNHIK